MSQTLLSEADIDASTRLTVAMVDFARILGKSPASNPHGLPTREIVFHLLHSPHYIEGLLAGCLSRLDSLDKSGGEGPQC